MQIGNDRERLLDLIEEANIGLKDQLLANFIKFMNTKKWQYNYFYLVKLKRAGYGWTPTTFANFINGAQDPMNRTIINPLLRLKCAGDKCIKVDVAANMIVAALERSRSQSAQEAIQLIENSGRYTPEQVIEQLRADAGPPKPASERATTPFDPTAVNPIARARELLALSERVKGATKEQAKAIFKIVEKPIKKKRKGEEIERVSVKTYDEAVEEIEVYIEDNPDENPRARFKKAIEDANLGSRKTRAGKLSKNKRTRGPEVTGVWKMNVTKLNQAGSGYKNQIWTDELPQGRGRIHVMFGPNNQFMANIPLQDQKVDPRVGVLYAAALLEDSTIIDEYDDLTRVQREAEEGPRVGGGVRRRQRRRVPRRRETTEEQASESDEGERERRAEERRRQREERQREREQTEREREREVIERPAREELQGILSGTGTDIITEYPDVQLVTEPQLVEEEPQSVEEEESQSVEEEPQLVEEEPQLVEEEPQLVEEESPIEVGFRPTIMTGRRPEEEEIIPL